MNGEIEFIGGYHLNDLVERRVRAAVARLIGAIYQDCRDGDILGMVLKHADFPIKEEMEDLLREIRHHQLMRVRDEKSEAS